MKKKEELRWSIKIGFANGFETVYVLNSISRETGILLALEMAKNDFPNLTASKIHSVPFAQNNS